MWNKRVEELSQNWKTLMILRFLNDDVEEEWERRMSEIYKKNSEIEVSENLHSVALVYVQVKHASTST